jgi:outer membrane protein
LEEALDMALSENPELLAQLDRRVAAREGVKAARGEVLPQIGLTASAAYADNERFGLELGEAEQYAVFLTGRWDLFDGGTGYARTGAAKRRAAAEVSSTRGLERAVRERTLAAWADLHTSRAALEARLRQVEAARLARDGVIQEFEGGRSTRLDVLDADRELADAEVGLRSARRDRLIAQFSMLRAMGKL